MLTNRKLGQRSHASTLSGWIPDHIYNYAYSPLSQQQQPHREQEAEDLCLENNNQLSTLDKLLESFTEDYRILLPANMTFRDRSSEFVSAARQLQSRMGNGVTRDVKAGGARRRISTGINESYSAFMRASSQVGRDLAATFVKLEKLTLLAKKKSLFDDRPLEIQELTYIIKQDIASLNKQIAQLQELSRSRDGSAGRHLATHSNSVVVTLQSKLASMSNDFKQVLEVRTENLKQQKSRRDQFSSASYTMAAPAAAPSLLLADDEAAQAKLAAGDSGEIAIDMGSVDGWRPSSGSTYNQRQLLMLDDEQDSYLQQRADTMQNIESTIVELGGIFQQLAHMVKEQEEMVTRIDSNIEETSLSVEAAHSELLKYFQSLSGNRWLMIKVFAVLIVFFIFFIVIAT